MTLATPAMTRHDCPHVEASGVFVVAWNQIGGYQVQVALCPPCERARHEARRSQNHIDNVPPELYPTSRPRKAG
jgi:hypothetical protein